MGTYACPACFNAATRLPLTTGIFRSQPLSQCVATYANVLLSTTKFVDTSQLDCAYFFRVTEQLAIRTRRSAKIAMLLRFVVVISVSV